MGFFSYFVIEIGSINFFLKLFMWKLHILKGSLVRGSRNEPLRHPAQRTRDCQVFNAPAKYNLQGTTQGRYLTGDVPPVRFSM